MGAKLTIDSQSERGVSEDASGYPLALPPDRFDQKNEMFKRVTYEADWVEVGARYFGSIKHGHKPGHRKLEYALRNAAWHVEHQFARGNWQANHGLYAWDDYSAVVEKHADSGDPVTHPPSQMSGIVKRAATFLGADLVGVSRIHPHLVYSHEYNLTNRQHSPIVLPADCKYAVVLAVEMDYEAMRHSPNCITGAATGLGYSRQAVVANLVAGFIRGLGYRAIPSGNDTALSIPLALAAGMGELGRNGLLITHRFGPRVRNSKVFTDMPLASDRYRPFGVEAFCNVCKKCARHCPSKSISEGRPTATGPTRSNHSGVLKWYINPETCFSFWSRNRESCSNCIRVCASNKSPGLIHDVVRGVIKHLPVCNRFMVWIDDVCGYGKTLTSRSVEDWWQTEPNRSGEL